MIILNIFLIIKSVYLNKNDYLCAINEFKRGSF